MSAALVGGTQSPQGARTAGIRARLALEAGGMVSWEWNVDTDEVVADQGFADLFGIATAGLTAKDVFRAIHEDDLPSVRGEVEAALSRDEDYVTEFRVLLRDGRHRWIGARGAVTARLPDGRPLRMLGVNWDMTEQKLQEERLTMMASEMNHRVENGFAIMGALIQIGARSTDDKESYADRLRVQVQALSAAHRLSVEATRQADDEEASVPAAGVVEAAIAAWRTDAADQVTLAFRAPVRLRPRQNAALAMLAYELATNALKHGALATPDGHLTVTLDEGRDGDAILRWTERTPEARNAGPVAPETGGFGGVLMAHCVKTLRGTSVSTLTPTGLRVEVTFPHVREKAVVAREAIMAVAASGGTRDVGGAELSVG